MFGKKVLGTYAACKKMFDSKGIKYTSDDEKSVVRCKYNGKHFKDLTFTLIFDDDGGSVALRVFSIESFSRSQLADAYEFCSKMNCAYRWVRFYVDSDDELTAALDAVITDATSGAICYELLNRSVSIVDDVVEELNK